MKHRIEIENKIVRKLFLELDVCERSYMSVLMLFWGDLL